MKAKMMIRVVFAVIVWMVFSFSGLSQAGDVILIVNKNVPVGSLKAEEVQGIFLANKTQWDNGQKIDFVTLQQCPVHDEFLKKFVQKTSSQYQRYFRTLVFTGKGKVPPAFDSEDKVVSYVASTEGAIGYVSSGTDIGAAKVLTVN